MNTNLDQRLSLNRISRRSVLAAGLLLAGCGGTQGLQLLAASHYANFEWQGALPITLPTRESNGWILVRGQVNGLNSVEFVLDTGAPITVLLAEPNMASIDLSELRRFGGANDLAAPTGAIQRNVALDFGPLRLVRHTVLAIPAQQIGCRVPGQNLPFGGVLGYELYNRFAVEIDRDAGVIRLHDPRHIAKVAQGIALPLEFTDRHPFVMARVQLPDAKFADVKLHLDSGAGSDLTLIPGSHPAITLPASGKDEASCFVGGQTRYRRGEPITLQLGSLPARSVPVNYTLTRDVRWPGQHGRLGARVLSHYNALFDYPGKRIFLRERRAN